MRHFVMKIDYEKFDSKSARKFDFFSNGLESFEIG